MVELVILVMFCVAMIVVLAGCQPEQQWGTGEPPVEYVGFFGNGNMARLNFVQTNKINAIGQQLQALIAANAEQHRILGQSDIDIYQRVIVLESVDPNDMRGPAGPQGPQGERCRLHDIDTTVPDELRYGVDVTISNACTNDKADECAFTAIACEKHDAP